MIEYYKNFSLEPLFYVNEKGLVCQEEWKDIAEVKNIYQSSNLGRIKSLDRVMTSKIGVKRFYKGKILAQVFNDKGYLMVGLSLDTKHQSKSVARLVAIAHIPNPDNLPEVNHCGLLPNGKEGNKLDNRAVSLKWSTSSENSQHSIDNGLQAVIRGEDHICAKLTETKVIEIRNTFATTTISYTKLGEQYGVSAATIRDAILRNTWKHI